MEHKSFIPIAFINEAVGRTFYKFVLIKDGCLLLWCWTTVSGYGDSDLSARSCFHAPSAGCTRAWLIYVFVCQEVKSKCCTKFCLKFDKNTWKTLVDPRRKVAWFAEDLNNDIKVSFVILSQGMKTFLKLEALSDFIKESFPRCHLEPCHARASIVLMVFQGKIV